MSASHEALQELHLAAKKRKKARSGQEAYRPRPARTPEPGTGHGGARTSARHAGIGPDVAWGALLLLLVLAAYWKALGAGYIWDDPEYLTENPLICSPGGLSGIWLTTSTPQYYPLVFTSFWIEFRFKFFAQVLDSFTDTKKLDSNKLGNVRISCC